ncbi:hypothetical protein C8Q78DRAFT_985162 [Trametes maxima]|nr:hypothetical protein C8Q78DRAFT_985162 [Trametes maxima]
MHCLFPFDLTDRTWYGLEWHKVATTEELLSLRIKQLARREQDIGQATENLLKTRQRAVDDFMKRNHHRIRYAPYPKGSWVLLHETWLDKQHGNKGALRWAGPYVVSRAHDNGSYLLRELDRTPLRLAVSGSRLRLFYFRDELQTLRSSFVADYADQLLPSQVSEPLYEYTCNLIVHERAPRWKTYERHPAKEYPTLAELLDSSRDLALGVEVARGNNRGGIPVLHQVEVLTRTNIQQLLVRK